MMNDNSGYGGYSGGGSGRRRRRPSLVIHNHRYVNPMYRMMGYGMPSSGMMYGRRRMMDMQSDRLMDYAENIEHGVALEKCVWTADFDETSNEICVRYDYVDRQFTVRYLQYMEENKDIGRVSREIEEWTVQGI